MLEESFFEDDIPAMYKAPSPSSSRLLLSLQHGNFSVMWLSPSAVFALATNSYLLFPFRFSMRDKGGSGTGKYEGLAVCDGFQGKRSNSHRKQVKPT